ncbi:hypothetical protein [Neobacillus niacini]|uniref:hypothetical protein n=1 Tax=Neobacillus niacini TaxID=86668 RepID=UPI0028583730|nr:hypothetical protein [Neobacillus niacini]MDR6999669.1 hypothetical protein [Neobacillus niacini]
MIDLEKETKRKLYKVQAGILEGYGTNMKQAMSCMNEGKNLFVSAHARDTHQWHGDARNEYEKMAAELNVLGSEIYNMGEKLLAELHKEIHQLKGKAKE